MKRILKWLFYGFIILLLLVSINCLISHPFFWIGIVLVLYAKYLKNKYKVESNSSKRPRWIKVIGIILIFISWVGCMNEISQQQEAQPKQEEQVQDSPKNKDINEDQENEKSNKEANQEVDKSVSMVPPIPEEKKEENKNSPSDDRILAKVIRVVDGDTLEVNISGKEEKVRLLLIDTPETVDPNKPVEPFGPEASDFTKKALTDKNVELEFDVQERDQYGRLLAYAWIDGKTHNERLLENGLAQVVVYQPNIKYVDHFRIVQKNAQAAKVGIWGQPSALDPQPQKQEPTTQKPNKQPKPQPASKWTEADFALDKDCKDFSSSREATEFMNSSVKAGYGDHRLDRDHDGIACE